MIRKVKLGDLIEFQRGYDLPKSSAKGGAYPVVTSNGIMVYHNECKSGKSVVIGRSGTIGNPQLIEFDFWPHNTTLYIKDFKNNDIDYIYYLLLNIDIGKMKSGSNIPTLNRNHLHPLVVWAELDINKQKNIARVLKTIDEKIKNNKKVNNELESMAKTIYDYWFLQFEFPNEDGKPYKSSGGKMVWNEELKKEIPEGWKIEELKNIVSITMGTSPKGDSININGEGIVFYQGKADFGNRFPIIRTYTKEPIRYAEKNDVLLSVRAPVGTMNIANRKCCIGRGLAAIHSEYSSFIFYLMLANQFKFDIFNNGGTTFGAITKDDLFGLKILIPTKNIIQKFDEKIKCIDQRIFEDNNENHELVSLRDYLLPLLMSGQIGFKKS